MILPLGELFVLVGTSRQTLASGRDLRAIEAAARLLGVDVVDGRVGNLLHEVPIVGVPVRVPVPSISCWRSS